MEVAIVWLLLALVVGVAASGRGRSGFGWFVLAVVLSPLIAGLLVLAMPSLKGTAQAPSLATHRKCPECAELVLKEARVCKHCGTKLEALVAVAARKPDVQMGRIYLAIIVVVAGWLLFVFGMKA